MKVKKFLNKVMNEHLAPIRERRHYWENRLSEVRDILQAGTETAERTAAETLNNVRNAMKINYFTDPDWLKEAEEKYR